MIVNRTLLRVAQVSLVAALGLTSSIQAQTSDKKEKEAMYTYVALWQVPRAKWAEYEKPVPANQKVMDQGVADGTLVGYGDDFDLIHSADGYTHDNWWSARSLAGLMKILDALEKLPGTTGGVMATITKHEDAVLVSHHYNWRPGSYKDAYTHEGSYRLKPTAPDDAVDVLSKTAFEPMLEKLLADGVIVEYEVDEEAIHTQDPNTFWVSYISPTAEGLDKVNAAVGALIKSNALVGPAFDSMVDFTPHRDFLTRTNATFK